VTVLMAVARENLTRSVPFDLVRADEEGDGLTLEGYGAVFDTPTRIDSWEGTFDESISRGAFKKSLRERTPRMQFDHGRHPLIGSLPIGRYDVAEEDTRGLHVVGRITDNWLMQPVRDAIAEGSVDGMSFRFSVVREEWRDKKGEVINADELVQLLWNPGNRGPLQRTLKEVKVPEVGPVVWPAYEETSVGVRSTVTIDLGRLHDPDQRATLARAVFLADAAEGSANDDPDAPPPGGHPSGAERTTDAPPLNENSPGQHPSTPSRGQRPIDLMVRKARDTIISLNTKGNL
jgi:HK97 family phage prohead protease